MDENIKLPLVKLDHIALMPGTIMHFDLKSKDAVLAIDFALKAKSEVLFVASRTGDINSNNRESLYNVGTIGTVRRLIKLGDNLMRAAVEGLGRAKIGEIVSAEPFCICTYEPIPDVTAAITDTEEKAMRSYILELIAQYLKVNPKLTDLFSSISKAADLTYIVNELMSQFPMPLENRQGLLEAESFRERYDKLLSVIKDETEILRLKSDLSQRVKSKLDQNQKEYIMREQMKAIREELGEDDTVSEADQFYAQCDALEADDSVKEKIRKEIKRFKTISGNSSESVVSRGYIETLLALPWNKKDPDFINLAKAAKILDDDHYGLEKVKERIIEFLAVRSLTTKGQIPILCLVGPPGTGKTSVAKSIARALDKKYIRVALGGIRDEAEIRGHRRTYVGALPGRIATGLKNAGVKNPLILLDEIDKVSSDYKGDPASALLEVLDSEQNSRFVDHYVEIPIDLSDVLFIATANTVQTIPRPLLDRMELIEISSYTLDEKVHIAKEHLVPKQLKRNGLSSKQLVFNKSALSQMILGYTREAGVRSLERRIGEVCRKVARELLEDEKTSGKALTEDEAKQILDTKERITVSTGNLEHYLGKVKYVTDKEKHKNEIGVVTGLAWTSVGGETLQVEVNTMPGKGKFELTGQLGDVMKESAHAGISFIRSVAGKYGIEPGYFESTDIHIHLPEGAVPKDGPSAGITMATAMLSAITGKKVRGDVAMTGEITLRGRVLPIGGLKEKIIAAKTAGIKTVILPEKNRRDTEDISAEILNGVNLVFVNNMDEVLKTALVK
ncbi:MAG: endopeptidase La [Lachnospiraceae bacterium]|nr:endopeptidase La [Lachnospiraceae bacterium]MBP5185135.1 endopeptidase La [Lachnospiraceae bacterium]